MGDVNMEALRAVVEKVVTVSGSAVALINGFADRIEAVKDDPIAIQAELDAIRDATDGLAAAVANVAPPPVEGVV